MTRDNPPQSDPWFRAIVSATIPEAIRSGEDAQDMILPVETDRRQTWHL